MNPRLAKDFPEVVYPLRSLEDNARRCKGQLWGDVQTLIDWGPTRITFPTIPKSKVSGSTLTVSGLTGALRGQSHGLATGEIIRPQFILADDPRTRESRLFQDSNRATARDNQRRLVGYGRTRPDDFLRHALHGDRARRPGRPTLEPRQEPAMAGRRTRWFTLSRPRKSCGRQYRQLREDSFRADGDGREATAFYKEHRAEMDEGAIVAWPERFNADEV